MRAAVLTLAFGPLAAEYAIGSAWSDNHASLAVSRALGYVDNGARRTSAARVPARWCTYASPRGVARLGVAGPGDRVRADECLVFFGLA